MTRKNESGQALVFAVLALGIVLLGFAGLGIDMGYMRYQKRLQQTAADAAAIAAANDLSPAAGGWAEAAQNAAAANGFTAAVVNINQCPPPPPAASVGSVSVTVNNPPCTGNETTNQNYVEVYVAEVQPTFFMRVLGINSETVTARAVATNVGGPTASGCLYTLGTSPNGISGGGTLAASTCDIIDDGDFNTGGNALTVSSDTTGIAGSFGGGTVTCTWNTSTCPTVGIPSSGNPLYFLTPPPVGTPIPFPANPTTTPPVPGSTYNGITITSGPVVFPPGIYVVDGGNFSIGSGAIVQGTGVTFYFTNGATITVAGAPPPDLQLSAPNSGQYAGILFYQDPNDTSSPTLGGDSGTFFQGALYFPTAQLTFSAAGTINSGAAYTIVVANSLVLGGGADVVLNSSYLLLPNGVSIIGDAVLAE